jgi:type III secretory pathway component EscV
MCYLELLRQLVQSLEVMAVFPVCTVVLEIVRGMGLLVFPEKTAVMIVFFEQLQHRKVCFRREWETAGEMIRSRHYHRVASKEAVAGALSRMP